MIMKKVFIKPDTDLVLLSGAGRPLCASTNNLTQLEEKDDLQGFDWSYN